MKLPVSRTPAALADMLEQFSFLAHESPSTARRFLDAVEQTLDTLSANPLLGGVYASEHPRLSNLRVWNVRGFDKHLLFYRATPDAIELIRVLHGSRDLAAILDVS